MLYRSAPREVKHLSTERKRYQQYISVSVRIYLHRDRDSGISLVAASEKEEAQTVVSNDCGVVRRWRSNLLEEKLSMILVEESAGKQNPRG